MPRSKKTSLTIAAVCAVLTAIGMWLFPLIADDLMSIESQMNAFLNGGSPDIEAFFSNFSYIYKYNHFRLPNLFMPVVILLPKWIPAIISCLAVFYILKAGSELGGFAESWKAMALFASGFVFLFPWIDQLYLISFQAPYLWGAALALMMLKMVLGHKKHSPVLMFLFGLLLGFWQEAYAGPVLTACVCLMAFYKCYRNASIAAAIAGMACGMLIIVSPIFIYHSWERVSYFNQRMAMVYPYLAVTLVHVVLSVSMLRKHRATVLAPLNLTMLAVDISSAVITLYFMTGSRVDGLGVICALVGCIYLLRLLHVSRKAVGTAAVAIGLAAVCHLCAVDVLCYRLKTETDFVLDRYLNYAEHPVFARMTLRENAPLIALQKPYYDWFAHDKTLNVFKFVYQNDKTEFEVVPQQLRDFTPEKAEAVPGDAGIFYYKDCMVAAGTPSKTYMVDFGKGPRMHSFHTVTFTNAAGVEYTWLHLDYASLEFMLHPQPVRACRL